MNIMLHFRYEKYQYGKHALYDFHIIKLYESNIGKESFSQKRKMKETIHIKINPDSCLCTTFPY